MCCAVCYPHSSGLSPCCPPQFHRFMLINDRAWANFNVASLGVSGGAELAHALDSLRQMKRHALAYARSEGRPGPIGLYFHVYPSNSVQSLHLHIVDLSTAGPTHAACAYKNMRLDDVIQALEQERAEEERAAEGGGDAGGEGAGGRARGGGKRPRGGGGGGAAAAAAPPPRRSRRGRV